jgi:hypothetical protein
MLDLQRGTKHVRDCFLSFGLKIHIGVRGGGKDGKDSESKTVAMLVPKVQDRKLSRMNLTTEPLFLSVRNSSTLALL